MKASVQAGWRILVPLDDSSNARRGLAYATELARESNGSIKLIRVTDPAADSGSNSLAANAERLRQTGVSVEWNVVDSPDVASAIVDTARAWPADIILMATSKATALDRWLNDSVTDVVIRSARVPVLVVPPEWHRPIQRGTPLRVLVPLDGSSLSEQILPVLLPLANAAPMDVVLVRAVESTSPGAHTYLRQMGSRVEDVLGQGHVITQVQEGHADTVILHVAQQLHVDAIAMCTHGRSGLKRALLGSVATSTLEQSSVPLLLLGPGALLDPATTAQIHMRAPVRSSDGQVVGEVHRVVVDLDQHAVVSVVVLGRGLLGRDVLVPADFIARANNGGLELNLTGDELGRLPDFAWNDYFTPPPWTTDVPKTDGLPLVAVTERKRVAPGEQDVTPGTRVLSADGDLGRVDRVEVDKFGQLEAFWVRADGVFGTDLRIPVEWLQPGEHNGDLRVAARREDIESYLGYESRARLHPR